MWTLQCPDCGSVEQITGRGRWLEATRRPSLPAEPREPVARWVRKNLMCPDCDWRHRLIAQAERRREMEPELARTQLSAMDELIDSLKHGERGDRGEKYCVYCWHAFIPKRADSVYCSAACKKRIYRIRERLKMGLLPSAVQRAHRRQSRPEDW